MTRYRVGFHTGAYSSVVVEAENVEDALSKASEAFQNPTICAQCSGMWRGPDLELGEEWEMDEDDVVETTSRVTVGSDD